MASYELPANANHDVLERKIDEVCHSLQTLNISNCIVAQQSLVMTSLRRLENLQTLLCVACPVRASLLLEHLLVPLHKVTHLEFSLVETLNNARDEIFQLRCMAGRYGGRKTNLRKVYVEVADEVNVQVMLSFLIHCPLVKELHIHFLRNVPFNLDMVAHLWRFTFTCEAPFTTQSGLDWPLTLKNCVDIHGNVARANPPEAFNCARLLDMAAWPERALLLEPVVLVVIDQWDLGKCLRDAACRRRWEVLRSLCIVSFARSTTETVYPAVGAAHDADLRDFFSRLTNIVELNVSSFHFGDGIDFTTLLETPALQRLRALSLPPCALRASGAFGRLARGLGDIEDLDIRLNLDGRHRWCCFCDNELNIDGMDTSALRIGSGRFTLSNVPKLASLDFLRHFHARSLRFIDVSERPRFDYKALSNFLRHNTHLISLVVRLANIGFNEAFFQTSMTPGLALQRLCLLTRSKMKPELAEHRVVTMAQQLPRIFYFHVHYVDSDTDIEATVTWIRLPDDEVADVLQQGKVMHNAPCIMCSTQTFIALVKPHVREL
ncbi:hypothetical protein HPB50_014451 [Hyalomma asiaticum]|uniref:Uncharacterized protein n=1 Tax=Hyalomma asiaticum TaxID=266040 RepID=A0ACB7T6X0_HYAAI|nr:hypothetical protein HPB50_014451 [Hyalomma asiaticum]